MSFPRALLVAPCAIWDLYKERLKFSYCKCSVLLLGADFKTMCILRNCHKGQTLTLVLVLSNTGKTPT